jgi:hypothetical protein
MASDFAVMIVRRSALLSSDCVQDLFFPLPPERHRKKRFVPPEPLRPSA